MSIMTIPNERDTLDDLFEKYAEFGKQTFKNATQYSSLVKLQQEIVELHMATLRADDSVSLEPDKVSLEYVDCIMCLIDSFTRYGISMAYFKAAFRYKLTENMNRKWIEQSDKTYKHE